MITAWQIQSTLGKMDEFIKFIQQFDKQRRQLQSVLPLIVRVKRIGEERQIINKQIVQLNKKGVLPVQIQSRLQERNSNNSNNKQRGSLELIDRCQSQLKRVSKQVFNKSRQNIKCVNKINTQLKERNIITENQLAIERQLLLSQFQRVVNGKLRSIQQRICDNSNYQFNQPIYQPGSIITNNNIKSHNPLTFKDVSIYGSVIDEQIIKRMNNINDEGSSSIKNVLQVQQQHVQLCQLKCRLLSLQDKRRKLIVKRLFNGDTNKMNKTIVSNKGTNNNKYMKQQQQISSNHNSIIANNNNSNKINGQGYFKSQQEQKQVQPIGLFRSIVMSIFSTKDVRGIQQHQLAINKNSRKDNNNNNKNNKNNYNNNNNNYNNKNNNKNNKNKNNNNNDNDNNLTNINTHQHPKHILFADVNNNIPYPIEYLPSLNQIQNNQVRLRVSQILSQIVEFKQHINVIVNQNIVNKFVSLISSIQQINTQSRCYINQLLTVGKYIKQELLNSNSNKNLHLQNNNDHHNRIYQLLYNNQQIQFFFSFITQKIMHRHKLIKCLLIDLLPSINIVTKYISKRMTEIQTVCRQFKGQQHQLQQQKYQPKPNKIQHDIIQQQLKTLRNIISNNDNDNNGIKQQLVNIQSGLLKVLHIYTNDILGYDNNNIQQIFCQQQQLFTNITINQCKLTIQSLLRMIANDNIDNNLQQQQYQYQQKQKQCKFYNKMLLVYQHLTDGLQKYFIISG